jgi:hypothetical protein
MEMLNEIWLTSVDIGVPKKFKNCGRKVFRMAYRTLCTDIFAGNFISLNHETSHNFLQKRWQYA